MRDNQDQGRTATTQGSLEDLCLVAKGEDGYCPLWMSTVSGGKCRRLEDEGGCSIQEAIRLEREWGEERLAKTKDLVSRLVDERRTAQAGIRVVERKLAFAVRSVVRRVTDRRVGVQATQAATNLVVETPANTPEKELWLIRCGVEALLKSLGVPGDAIGVVLDVEVHAPDEPCAPGEPAQPSPVDAKTGLREIVRRRIKECLGTAPAPGGPLALTVWLYHEGGGPSVPSALALVEDLLVEGGYIHDRHRIRAARGSIIPLRGDSLIDISLTKITEPGYCYDDYYP